MRELRGMSQTSKEYYNLIITNGAYLSSIRDTFGSHIKALNGMSSIRKEIKSHHSIRGIGSKYDIYLNVARHLGCLNLVHKEMFAGEIGNKEDFILPVAPAAPPSAVPNPCKEIPMPALSPSSIICTKPGSINTMAEAQRYANFISSQVFPPFVKQNSSKMHDEWMKAKDSLWDPQYFKPTEETPMKFVTIEKQLLVNGENVLALNAEQLTTRISELKKRQDELYDIPFSSKRIGKEIDKLDNIMSKLIKRLDRM